MKNLRRQGGFTLIELLVVILILAILMAIALPLYLRAVKDSEKQTCRANMQTIAAAEQAHKVRSATHVYTDNLASDDADATALCGTTKDLQQCPRCPNDTNSQTPDYTVTLDSPSAGQITIKCANDDAAIATFHNTVTIDGTEIADHGFVPGVDSQ
jgi:prepilin-type N-terminal cleavage/methylation domain-containing protein